MALAWRKVISGASPKEGCCLDRGPRHDRPTQLDSAEAGFVLLAVVFMVALLVISLAIAAPKVAAAIQRDREIEMIHRGDQYKRAIRLYYKKFGSYPTSIDQLEKTNNIRFLRKRYLDPLTGKDDWKLIHMGQAHVRPLGFFGQSLGGSSTGIAGAQSVANGSIGGGLGGSSTSNGSSAFGGNSGGGAFGSNAGSSAFGGSSGGSSFGGGFGGNAGAAQQGAAGAATGNGGGLYAPADVDDGSGTGTGSTTGSSTSLGAGASSSTTLGQGSSSSTGFGTDTSTTLGGGPVVGVMPPQTKATILQYKLKTKYNEWEFVYDPVEEQMAAGSILGGSGNVNANGNSVNGPGSTNLGSGAPGSGTSNGAPGPTSTSGGSTNQTSTPTQ